MDEQTSDIASGVRAMKVRVTAVALVGVAATFFAIGSATARNQVHLSKATLENLSTAMHGEAFAYAKYLLFADHARQSGNTELANLFESTAKTERFEHFAEQARLAGVVGSDADNLRDAIKGESYEVSTMYRQFAEQAAAAGDKAAAQLFTEIGNDERKHRDAFQAALTKIEKKSSGK